MMGSFFIYFLFINTMMKESNAMSVLHTFSIKLADVSIKNNTSYVLITSPPFPLCKRVTTRHDCFFYLITRAYFFQQKNAIPTLSPDQGISSLVWQYRFFWQFLDILSHLPIPFYKYSKDNLPFAPYKF